jgi:hypothetical protein
MLEVGTEDMMAMLNLVDDGGELAGQPSWGMLNKTTPTMKSLRQAAASKSTIFWMALSAR